MASCLRLFIVMFDTAKICFRKRLFLILALSWMNGWLVPLSSVASPNLTLVWNPSQNPDVIGYKVYYGTISLTYTNVMVAGNNTNAIMTGIKPGITYYFAATTYNANGMESAPSVELAYTAPMAQPATLASASRSANQFSFSVSGTAGLEYVVEASTNLVDWDLLGTNTAPFTFEDTDTGGFSQKFYRTFSLQ